MAERVEHELSQAESDVLTAATKDAMAGAGALGGSLGSPIGHSFTGARGGAAGGRFGARFTRPRSAATEVEVAQDPAAVRERRARASPRRRRDRRSQRGGRRRRLGDGALRRAGHDARAHPRRRRGDAGGGSRVQVRATGREGLIKQAIAAKAVDRMCAAIARHPS